MGSRRAHSTRRLTASTTKHSARRQPAHKPPHLLYQQLAQIGQRLEALYATCVTVTLALKQQNGDEDAEIARCLIRNVTDPLRKRSVCAG